jgi:hypothetical protein
MFKAGLIEEPGNCLELFRFHSYIYLSNTKVEGHECPVSGAGLAISKEKIASVIPA